MSGYERGQKCIKCWFYMKWKYKAERGESLNYKTLLIPVNCNKKDYEYLLNCNKLSAEVWNLCLELDQKYKNETGKYINRNE